MASSPFPFHGIFSAMQQEKSAARPQRRQLPDEDTLFPPHQEARQAPAPQQPAQTQRPQGVGQVAVDIFEYDNYYIIKAPIAGVRLCDLDIEVADNVVTIRGVRRQTDQIPGESYFLQECFWGEFARSVTLPCAVDPKRVKATFNKESILKILIPKEEKVKIVRITEN